MPKSNAERQRDYRARKREGGTLGDRLAKLETCLKALDRRVTALEDGPRAVRAAGGGLGLRNSANENTGRFDSLPAHHVERPGLGDLQARVDQVVTRTDHPATVTPTFDPRTLTGQALRDYVRQHGPIPTDDPGDAA